jgi:hypothetical protein
MSYEALLDELETLQKALPGPGPMDDDEDEDEEDEGHAEPDADNRGGPSDGDADNRPLAKSFRFELDDGSAVEAVDATDLLKSLHDDLAGLRASRTSEAQAVETGFKGLLTLVKGQGALLKSLQAQVAKLADSGRGRKSLTGGEADLAKAQAATPELTGPLLLAKAHTAFEAQRISGKELSTLDVLLRHGETPDADLVRRILA